MFLCVKSRGCTFDRLRVSLFFNFKFLRASRFVQLIFLDDVCRVVLLN